MSMSILTLTFLVGLALIVVAIVGGGIEIKEIKIPTLPIVPRTLSFIVGCTLLAVCVLSPQILQQLSNQQSSPEPKVAAEKAAITSNEPFLGAAIKNRLVTVRDVKLVLRHDGKYTGPIDDQPNDS